MPRAFDVKTPVALHDPTRTDLNFNINKKLDMAQLRQDIWESMFHEIGLWFYEKTGIDVMDGWQGFLNSILDILNADIAEAQMNWEEFLQKIRDRNQSLLNNWFDALMGNPKGTSSDKTWMDVYTAATQLHDKADEAFRTALEAKVANEFSDFVVDWRAAAGTNLVLSPHFSQSTVTRFPLNDLQFSGYSIGEEHHSGLQCWKWTHYNNLDCGITLAPTTRINHFDVVPGEVFTVEAWVHPHGANILTAGDIRIGGTFIDTSGGQADQDISYDCPQNGPHMVPAQWNKINVELTVPSGVDKVRFWVKSTSNTHAGNVFHIDDVLVREKTDAKRAQVQADWAEFLTGLKSKTGSNLIVDPKFGLGNMVARFPFNQNQVYGYSTVQEPHWSGLTSWKWTQEDSAACGFVMNPTAKVDKFQVRDGERYRVQGRLFAPTSNVGVAGAIRIGATFSDSDNALPALDAFVETLMSAVTKGSWMKLSATLDVPAGYDTAQFWIIATSTTAANRVFYVDDVAVWDGAAAEADSKAVTAQENVQTLVNNIHTAITGDGSPGSHTLGSVLTNLKAAWSAFFDGLNGSTGSTNKLPADVQIVAAAVRSAATTAGTNATTAIAAAATADAKAVAAQAAADDAAVGVQGVIESATMQATDYSNIAAGSNFETWAPGDAYCIHPWDTESAGVGRYSVVSYHFWNDPVLIGTLYHGTMIPSEYGRCLRAGAAIVPGTAMLKSHPTVRQGEKFYVEFWARCDDYFDGGALSKFRIGYNDENIFLADIPLGASVFATKRQWKFFNIEVTIPQGAYHLNFEIYTDHDNTNEDWVWDHLDDQAQTEYHYGPTHLGQLFIDDIVVRRQVPPEGFTEIPQDKVADLDVNLKAIAAYRGSNLITNGTFEDSNYTRKSWRGFYWDDYGPGAGFDMLCEYSTEHVRTGTQSVKMRTGGLGWARIELPLSPLFDGPQSIPCTSSDVFQFETWVYGAPTNTFPPGGGGIGCIIWPFPIETIVDDEPIEVQIGAQGVGTAAHAESTGVWTKISGIFSPPAGCTQFTFTINASADAGGTYENIWWVDDVALYRVTDSAQALAAANTGITNAALADAKAVTADAKAVAAQVAVDKAQAALKSVIANGPSIIFDGGFENDFLWNPLPTANSGGVRSTEQAHTGTQSWKAVADGSTTKSVKLNSREDRSLVNWPTAGGRKYSVEAWVFPKATNSHAAGFVSLYAQVGISGGTFAYTNVQFNTSTLAKGVWQKATGVLTIPANAVDFNAYIRLDSTCTNGDTFYWDDARLVDITEAYDANVAAVAAQATANTGVTNAATADGKAVTADGKAVAAQGTANTATTTANTATTNLQTVVDGAVQAVDGGTATGAAHSTVKTKLQLAWANFWDGLNGSSGATSKLPADVKTVAAAVKSTAGTALTNAATADGKAVTADGKAVAAQSTANTATTNLQTTVDAVVQAVDGGTATGATHSTVKDKLALAWANFWDGLNGTTGATSKLPGDVKTVAAAVKSTAGTALTNAATADGKAVTATANAAAADAKAVAAQVMLNQKIAGGSSLTTNSGFEDSTQYLGTGARFTYSTEQKYAGTQSAKFTSNGVYQGLMGVTDTTYLYVPVTPGQVYYMEAMIYGHASNAGTGSGGILLCAFFNPGNVPVTAIEKGPADIGKSNWYKLSGYLTVPANVTSMCPRIDWRQSLTVGDIYYVDSFRVVEVTDAYTATTNLQTVIDGAVQAVDGGTSTGATPSTVKAKLTLAWANFWDGLNGTTGATSKLPSDVKTVAAAVKSTAGTALTNAATADGKAVTADGKAVTADGKAVTATTNAATAQGTANTATTNLQTVVDSTVQAVDGGSATGAAHSTVKDKLLLAWSKLFDGLNGTTGSTTKLPADAYTAAAAVKANAALGVTNAATADGKAVTAQGTADVAKVAALTGTNLVTNPGFESSRFSNYAQTTTAQKHSGTRSLTLTANGSQYATANLTCDESTVVRTACSPGDRFYVEFWVFGKSTNVNTTSNVWVQFDAFDKDMTSFSYPLVGVVGGTALNGVWTKVTGYVTMPTNTAFYDVLAVVEYNCPSGNQYYWDDIIIREVTAGNVADGKAVAAQATANTGVTNAATADGKAATADGKAVTADGKAVAAQNLLNAAATSGANLITDPSFEDTTLDTVRAIGQVGAYVYDSSRKHSGARSVKNTYVAASFPGLFLTPTFDTTKKIAVRPGQVFYMSQWVWANTTNTGSSQVLMYMQCDDTTGVLATTWVDGTGTTGTVARSGNWVKQEGYATIPAGYDRAFAYMAAVRPGNNTGDIFWFDDMSVVEVTDAYLANVNAVAAQATANTGVANAATADGKAVTADGKAVVAQTLATGGLARGSNIVSNPSFENTTFYLGGGAYSTEQKRTGSQSVKVVHDGTNWILPSLNTSTTGAVFIPVAGGDVFAVEAWVYGHASNVATTQQLWFQINYQKADNTGSNLTCGNLTAGTALNGVWTKLSGTMTMPSDGVRINNIWITGSNLLPAGQTFYWDDCVVREITATQTVIDGTVQAVDGGTATGATASTVKTKLALAWANFWDGLNGTSGATSKLPSDVKTVAAAVKSTAGTALTNAATADGKAVTADGKAVAAQTTANTGVTNAATADGKAVTATTNAATADGKAVAAQGTANTATTNLQTVVDSTVQAVDGGTATGAAHSTVKTKLQLAWSKIFDGLNGSTGSTTKLPADAYTAAAAVKTNAALGVTNAATADGKAVTAQNYTQTVLDSVVDGVGNGWVNTTPTDARDGLWKAWGHIWDGLNGTDTWAQKYPSEVKTVAAAVKSTAGTALTNAATADGKAVTADGKAVTADGKAVSINNTLFGQSTPGTTVLTSVLPTALTTVGSGFIMTRTSGTINVSCSPNTASGNRFSVSDYSAVASSTDDYTVSTSGYLNVTASVAGWYMVEVAFGIKQLTYPFRVVGYRIAAALYKNGTMHKIGSTVDYAGSTSAQQPFCAQASFIVYLNSGDYVGPGAMLYSQSTISNMDIIGANANGADTYFSVSLLNRSLA